LTYNLYGPTRCNISVTQTTGRTHPIHSKISNKFVHNFLSYPADRQTDRQTNRQTDRRTDKVQIQPPLTLVNIISIVNNTQLQRCVALFEQIRTYQGLSHREKQRQRDREIKTERQTHTERGKIG